MTLTINEEASYSFSEAVLRDVPAEAVCDLEYRLLDAATGDELEPLIFDFDFGGDGLPSIRGVATDEVDWLARSPLGLQIEVSVPQGG